MYSSAPDALCFLISAKVRIFKKKKFVLSVSKIIADIASNLFGTFQYILYIDIKKLYGVALTVLNEVVSGDCINLWTVFQCFI